MEIKPAWYHGGKPESASEPTPLPGEAPLKDRVIEAIRSVYDPEIPVNVYDLGLIYTLDIDENSAVSVTMTLTAPGCPVAGVLPGQVESAIKAVEGVCDAHVQLVWDPPWDRDCMSDEAKLALGLF
jgi:FeS assembly SUF system protein